MKTLDRFVVVLASASTLLIAVVLVRDNRNNLLVRSRDGKAHPLAATQKSEMGFDDVN